MALRTRTVRAAPWSARRWCDYFRANARALMALPWHLGAGLSASDRDALAGSLQDFQLGESSEGRNLLARAAEYAQTHAEPEYVQAMWLFIREEQRHAHDLGRFLLLADIPLLERTRLDSIFRFLRRMAGLELCIAVLVTAEVIGTVYYRSVRRATGSILLRRLCEQLLRDEAKHVRFHAERLAILRRGRSRWRTWLGSTGHRVLYVGATLAVWLKHRCALRAGGLGFAAFHEACAKERQKLFSRITPGSYSWERQAARRRQITKVPIMS